MSKGTEYSYIYRLNNNKDYSLLSHSLSQELHHSFAINGEITNHDIDKVFIFVKAVALLDISKEDINHQESSFDRSQFKSMLSIIVNDKNLKHDDKIYSIGKLLNTSKAVLGKADSNVIMHNFTHKELIKQANEYLRILIKKYGYSPECLFHLMFLSIGTGSFLDIDKEFTDFIKCVKYYEQKPELCKEDPYKIFKNEIETNEVICRKVLKKQGLGIFQNFSLEIDADITLLQMLSVLKNNDLIMDFNNIKFLQLHVLNKYSGVNRQEIIRYFIKSKQLTLEELNFESLLKNDSQFFYNEFHKMLFYVMFIDYEGKKYASDKEIQNWHKIYFKKCCEHLAYIIKNFLAKMVEYDQYLKQPREKVVLVYQQDPYSACIKDIKRYNENIEFAEFILDRNGIIISDEYIGIRVPLILMQMLDIIRQKQFVSNIQDIKAIKIMILDTMAAADRTELISYYLESGQYNLVKEYFEHYIPQIAEYNSLLFCEILLYTFYSKDSSFLLKAFEWYKTTNLMKSIYAHLNLMSAKFINFASEIDGLDYPRHLDNAIDIVILIDKLFDNYKLHQFKYYLSSGLSNDHRILYNLYYALKNNSEELIISAVNNLKRVKNQKTLDVVLKNMRNHINAKNAKYEVVEVLIKFLINNEHEEVAINYIEKYVKKNRQIFQNLIFVNEKISFHFFERLHKNSEETILYELLDAYYQKTASYKALGMKIMYLSENGRFEEALEIVGQLKTLFPNDFIGTNFEVRLYMHFGRVKEISLMIDNGLLSEIQNLSKDLQEMYTVKEILIYSYKLFFKNKKLYYCKQIIDITNEMYGNLPELEDYDLLKTYASDLLEKYSSCDSKTYLDLYKDLRMCVSKNEKYGRILVGDFRSFEEENSKYTSVNKNYVAHCNN